MHKNKKAKAGAKASGQPETATEPKGFKLLASTARILERLIPSLAAISQKEDAAKAAADKAAADIEKRTESAKADWRAIASEHKDKAERKALAQRIHKALMADHDLSSQRASDMLKKIGLGGLIRADHKKPRVELPDGIVELLFELADEKLGADGDKVKTALSRAYGKARDVYRKG